MQTLFLLDASSGCVVGVELDANCVCFHWMQVLAGWVHDWMEFTIMFKLDAHPGWLNLSVITAVLRPDAFCELY